MRLKTLLLAVLVQAASSAAAADPSPLGGYSLTSGATFASLYYTHNQFKSSAFGYRIPTKLEYKDLWTFSFAYTNTVLRFNPAIKDAYRREFTPSATYNVDKHLTLRAAFEYIMVNDFNTDAGKVYTGGLTYQVRVPDSRFYFSLGGYESYSTYRPFRVVQTTPHVLLGWGPVFADLYMMYTNVDKNNENLRAYGGTLSCGPFWGLTPTLSGFTGDKRLNVEEWGTVVNNTQDLFRRGWRAGLSYLVGGLKVFAQYGIDNGELTVPSRRGPVNFPYTARITIAGLSYRL